MLIEKCDTCKVEVEIESLQCSECDVLDAIYDCLHGNATLEYAKKSHLNGYFEALSDIASQYGLNKEYEKIKENFERKISD